MVCPRCAQAIAPDLRYCTGCGHALAAAAGARASREERRRVSVLFIDAVGFTPYAERADPEAVRVTQTEFFATVRRVVHRYGGVVEKYIGDAVMALFGAPVATETDALRCVRAGMDMQRELAREDVPAWTYRVGIASGEALVDMAAAHDGGQAIVAGDVVNTAARLQSRAPAGGVLVCGVTRLATRAEIGYAEQPPVILRGRSSPTEVWLAVATVGHDVDHDPDAVPLVGRDHELGLLAGALSNVMRERAPRIVTVLGPAGVGKSRLVRELFRHAAQLDVPVCWRGGRCPPFGENMPYPALAEIVRAHVGVLATDPPEVAGERLHSVLRDLFPAGDSARIGDALYPLIGLPGPPLPTEDAESAWRRFLGALAARGPTVLVFENLHWAGDRMVRFVQLLGATLRDVPLLVVCTARPEFAEREPGWAASVPGMLAISLTPLGEDAIASLYAGMFGDRALPPNLLQPLVDLADGMPLYAHEYGRMLAERGTQVPAPESTAIGAGDDALPVPESVHAVIANRIDLLDADERAVLQAAAVVGRRFWPGAVTAALGASAERVEHALRTLIQRGLVREATESRPAGEPELLFRHTLVADICYERLPLSERVTRHARTADWLDAQINDRGTDLGTDISAAAAHHRYAAFETALALGIDRRAYATAALAALRRAARRAIVAGSLTAAATHLNRAEQVLASTGEAPAQPDQLALELLGVELSLNQDPLAFRDGTGPGRLADLARMLYQADDAGGAARAWTLLGQVAWLRADRTGALRYLDRAIELFDSCPDTPEKAHAYAELGRLHMLNYEHEPALGATQVAAEIAAGLGLVELHASALITMGMCRYQAGAEDGLVELRRALEYCRSHRLPSLRLASQLVADALREEGDAAGVTDLDAIDPAGSGPQAAELVVVPPTLAVTTLAYTTLAVTTLDVTTLGGAGSDALRALLAGDWDRFFTVADDLLAASRGQRDPRLRGVRGWMRALRGDADGAYLDAAQALDEGRSSGFWRLSWAALAHGALCHALLDRGDDAAALLAELSAGWRRMHTIARGEWVSAAGHAAARVGADAALILHEALAETPHHTAWSRAALACAHGAIAAARGDLTSAAVSYFDAAERYASVGSSTDRFLALGSAVRVLSAAADVRTTAARDEVARFASHNRIVSPL